MSEINATRAAGSSAPACSAVGKPTQNEFRCPHDCQYWYPEECARPEFTRCPIKYPPNSVIDETSAVGTKPASRAGTGAAVRERGVG